MNDNGVSMNGYHRSSRKTVRRGSGRGWPVLIVGLISLNATIVGITVFFAVADRSVATEPDYYAKALKYDEQVRARQESARLGWAGTASIGPGGDGRASLITIELRDREGRAVDGAAVNVVVFANVRSGQRQSLRLQPVAGSNGTYAAPVIVDRAGLWHVTTSATRGGDAFIKDEELLVAEKPIGG